MKKIFTVVIDNGEEYKDHDRFPICAFESENKANEMANFLNKKKEEFNRRLERVKSKTYYDYNAIDKIKSEEDSFLCYGSDEPYLSSHFPDESFRSGSLDILDAKNREEKIMKRSYSQYARIFDASSTILGKDQEYNYMLLPSIQAHLNDVLKCKGYLFLNEAYKFMGFPEIREGQLVGWIYNNTRKDSVDFRIPKKMPKNGNSILVDFNATPILDLAFEKEG